jgi:NADPH2:quinone reductase
MRGVQIIRAGGSAGRLEVGEFPLPELAADTVLIRTAYAGINRADLLQVEGSYAPPEGASPLPGMEVSGTIAALGAQVQDWRVGEEVCALISGGGYAEYVAAPAAQTLPLPASISLRDAASLPEAAATSVMALVLEANLQPGERVLLHGGTSGVGLIMAQVAHAWGAEVFATVGSAEKANFLRGFEVHPINHRTSPFGEQVMQATHHEGVDVIIDILGAPHIATHFKLLRRGGRMVSLAMMDGNVVESLKISGLLMKHLHWSGATLRSRSATEKAQIIAIVRERVWPHLASGAIRAVVDGCFPLETAEKAHQRMQERLHMGKILLEVAP